MFKNNFFFILILISAFAGCVDPDRQSETKKELSKQPAPGYNPYENSKITVQVFKVDSIETTGSKGWGYDILINDELYIHQPNIPSVMGNNGFSSEEKARDAGEFVIYKIRNNIIPPSVTPNELDSLGVLD